MWARWEDDEVVRQTVGALAPMVEEPLILFLNI
jgi:hypothetical protein